MAVLKDLIVHGPSRFLNTSYFNQLKTDKIGAEEGIFNKIVATTGDIGSLTVEDLTAGKATVLSLLDVRGELHTNQWTNSNIATIDGSFYITPTIGVPSGTMTTTANSVVVNGSNFPISSLYVNGTNSDNTATTVAWTSGSKVLVTGEILVNGTYMPLGTLVGVLDGNATATQIKIKSITDNRYQTAESLAEIGTQSTALPCRNVKVSLYQTSRSSTLYPLGIFMTALGENGRTFLDIYGGGYATSTAVAGGFAKPVLRIGNLKDLPAVGGSTPTGYGIYTSNGYFSGTIVAKQGKIGDGTAAWTIGNDSNNRAYIYSGITNITTSGSTTGTYVGTNGISNYASATQYVNLTGGKITAQGADIAGKITATSGSIAGWRIESTYLASGNATSPAANVLLLSPAGTSSSYTVAGQAKTGWVITAGTTFGVNKDGGIYATSGKIGGFDIGTTYLRNGNITSATNTSVAGVYLGTDGLNISNGTAATTSYITKTAVNIGNKLTWNGTTLTIDGTASIGGTTASTVVSNAANGATAKTELDNLEIGGRNLLQDTDAFGTVFWPRTSVMTVTTGQSDPFGGTSAIKLVGNNSDSYQRYGGYTYQLLKNTGTYTISLWAKADTAWAMGIGFNRVSNSLICNLTTEWQYFEKTITISSIAEVDHFVFGGWGSWPTGKPATYIYHPKLEKGNKATAWSPAPEDLDVHKYVTDIDTNKGITIKPLTSTGNDYLQMDSTSIDFYRGIGTNSAAVSVMSLSDSVFRMGTTSGNHTTVDSNGLNVYKGSETAANKVATFGSSITLASNEATVTIGSTSKYHTVLSNTAMEFKNGANTTNATLMSISGNVITLYKPNTTTAAATLNSNGLVIASGTITLGSNFSVNSSGSLTATGATLKNITLQDSNSKTRATVDTNGLKIFDASNNLKAQFGTDIDLYGGSSATGAMPKININATNGITIAYSNTNKAIIDSNGMKVYKDDANNPMAQFGNIIRIGKEASSQILINSDNFKIFDNAGKAPIFNCGSSSSSESVTFYESLNGISDNYLPTTWANGMSFSVLVVSNLGQQGDVEDVHDFIVGTSKTSVSSNSTVVYNATNKSINWSSEGQSAVADLYYTLTLKTPSFYYGTIKTAPGSFSCSLGRSLSASGSNQLVIGKYNSEDTNKVFIIGKGTSSSSSNALTVDWSGNVDIASGAKYKINGTALSASDVGAVPTTRTVNSKALSSNISLTASDVSAVPTSDVSTTGGNNKVIKSDSSGNVTITGNISTGHAPSTGQIGEIIKNEPSAVSTGTAKYYQLASVTLTPGIWVYMTTVEFAANTTGYRRAYTTTDSFSNGTTTAPAVVAKALVTNVAQAGGQMTYTHDAMPFTVTTNTTYRLVAYQNSGSTLSVTGRIYAVRIA